ncbi:general odorant-binding protein 84a [Galleria mellonella]|uniref:General odorant-binding protein 84a n=1 Tax=Galleria mellonella TaxID=7137 RepID=A0A6J1WKJ4_GALME|nr:general odorant-binding protein 84a [Galleria mellonella]
MSRVLLLVVLAVQSFVFTELASVSKTGSDVKETDRDDYKNMTSTGLTTVFTESRSSETELDQAMNECNETFRVEMSYLESLNESGSFPDETDRTPKCYVRCVLEKTGVASEDGNYDPARTAVIFAGKRAGRPMNDIEEIATGCANRKESCKCERAYQYIKCMMETEIRKYE